MYLLVVEVFGLLWWLHVKARTLKKKYIFIQTTAQPILARHKII